MSCSELNAERTSLEERVVSSPGLPTEPRLSGMDCVGSSKTVPIMSKVMSQPQTRFSPQPSRMLFRPSSIILWISISVALLAMDAPRGLFNSGLKAPRRAPRTRSCIGPRDPLGNATAALAASSISRDNVSAALTLTEGTMSGESSVPMSSSINSSHPDALGSLANSRPMFIDAISPSFASAKRNSCVDEPAVWDERLSTRRCCPDDGRRVFSDAAGGLSVGTWCSILHIASITSINDGSGKSTLLSISLEAAVSTDRTSLLKFDMRELLSPSAWS